MASLTGFPDAFTATNGTALGTYDAKYVVSTVANTGGVTVESNAVRMRVVEAGAGYTAHARFYITGSARSTELIRTKFTVVDASKECFLTFFMRGSAGWTAGADKQPTVKSYGLTVRPAGANVLDLSCYHGDDTYTALATTPNSTFTYTTGHQYGLVGRLVGYQVVFKLWDITASETEAAPKVTYVVDALTLAAAEQTIASGEVMVRLVSGAAATTTDITLDDLDVDDLTAAAMLQVGDMYVGSMSVSTTSQNASSASSDNGPVTLTQHYFLTVANASSASSDTGAVALTQHNVLVVANASSAHTAASAGALTQHYFITVANASSASSADNCVLTAHSPAAIPANASSASSDTGPVALTQHNILVVANASSATSDNNPQALTQHYFITVANGSSASSDTGPTTLTQHNVLVVQNASSAQTADAVALTQHNVLVVANASSAQSTGSLALTQHYFITVQGASSATTSDNVTFPFVFNIPSDIGGMLVWLDASAIAGHVDGDAIGSWTDQSGGGRHGVAAGSARPLYKTGILNSKPVLRFDGVDDYMTVPVTDDDSVTLIAVMQKRSAPIYASQVAMGFGGSPGGSEHLDVHAFYSSGFIYYPDNGFGVVDVGGTPTTAQIVAIRVTSDSSLDIYLNGDLVAAKHLDPEDNIGAFDQISLAATYYGSDFGDYDFAEVCMYDSALSDARLRNVFAYEATKWGVSGPRALAPANASSASSSGNVALTQHNVLVVQNASSAHTATSPTVSLLSVYPANASSATSSGNVVLVPAFLPNTLSGLLVWLDANAIAGKVDGDTLSQWNDMSGGSRHATQATIGARPTYKTNILNGKPVVRFDGINDFMSAAVTDNASITIVAVMQKRTPVSSTSANAFALAEPNAGSHQIGTETFYNPGFLYYPDDTFTVVGVGGTPTTAQIVAVRLNSTASLDVFVAGVTTPIVNVNPQDQIGGFTALFLGSDAYGIAWGDFDFAEVCLYNSALSGANLASLFGYLGTKWLVAAPINVQLTVQNASSATTSGNVTATQHNVLVVQNASSAHAAQNVATRFMLAVVANASSQMASTNVGPLVPHFPLTVQNASSAHTATACNVTVHGRILLVVASCAHSQAATGPFRLGVSLQVANCTMASSATGASGVLLHPRAPSGYTQTTGIPVRDASENTKIAKVT